MVCRTGGLEGHCGLVGGHSVRNVAQPVSRDRLPCCMGTLHIQVFPAGKYSACPLCMSSTVWVHGAGVYRIKP